MPITQDRMLALIAAADEMKKRFQDVQLVVDELLREAERGEITLSQLRAGLFTLFHENRPSMETIETISKEREHFRLSRSKNEYMKRRQQRLRAGVESPSLRPTTERRPFIQATELEPRPQAGFPPSQRLTREDIAARKRQVYEEDLATHERTFRDGGTSKATLAPETYDIAKEIEGDEF